MVKVLPRYEALEKKLHLTLVDRKRHYEGVRKGVVESVGRGVRELSVGETVIFNGELGESFGMTERGADDGTDWRRLRAKDVLAVEET